MKRTGSSADRRVGPHRAPHRARHLAVQRADRVDVLGRAHGERGHVELRSLAVVVRAEGQEAFAVLAHVAPAARQVLFDLVERERVVAGRHRCVGGEHRRAAHRGHGLVERGAALDVFANALQRDERRVPFVQVPHRGRDAQRAQRAHAADAEDHLLLDAHLAVAAVEARRELAIPRRVLREIGVEQEQAHAPEPNPPDRGQHRAIAERHRGHAGPAFGREGGLDWRLHPRQPLVAFLLPAVVRHPLVEVALRIHEADADERHAEIAGLLAVVAGQHAQAAGVDRQGLVQRELRREVRQSCRC